VRSQSKHAIPDEGLPDLRLISPSGIPRVDTLSMLSAIARLVAAGTAETKSALVDATGLARSTVTSYVDMLLRRHVLEAAGTVTKGVRGRPADRLQISGGAGLVLAIDLGARHARLGIGELNQRILVQTSDRMDIREGPEAVLGGLSVVLEEHLARIGEGRAVRAVVIGVPARVHGPSGMTVRPNIMPGWDRFPISHWLERRFGAPAILENDVNLRAVGEAAALPDDQRPILVLKVGTGVGAGMVDQSGGVLRGYDGSAGDIGHTPVRGAPVRPCTCGNSGCVEAAVSVPSIIRQLREEFPGLIDDERDDLDQLTALLARSEPTAVSVVRGAAEILGEVVAMLCNTLNPRRVVLGGDLTASTDEILAGVRTVAYQRARPLATRNLVITHSRLGEMGGVAGALVLGREAALSPEGLRLLHTSSAGA